MKRGLIHVGAMAMALAALPCVMAAPAQAAVQNDGTDREALAAAIEAVRSANMLRVSEDAAYAEVMLGHLDRIEPLANTPAARLALDDIRMVALASLRRGEELGPVFDRIMDRRPRDTDQYGRAWWAALVVNDVDRVAAVVEHASRNIPASGWGELRSMFERDVILHVLRQLRSREDDAGRSRLAAALFRIGWPGSSERGLTDFLRSILIDDHLRRDENRIAAEYAAGIADPDLIASLIVQRRYDGLFPDGSDRLTRLEAALAEHDRSTGAELAANPADMRRVLNRAQLLRTLGRDREAADLLQPFTRDIAATVRAHEMGLWLINELVFTMIDQGRGDDAAALMGRLAALPIDETPELISTSINYGAVLWLVGRPAEALGHSRMLEGDAARHASEYGKMWIRANIVCALAALNRADEAGPVLDAMREVADENQAALTRSYLCLDDLDAAEALMIRRLEGNDPGQALLALQDYALVSEAAPPDPVYVRLEALRDRPAIRAAVERVGRVLRMPVARTYWGGV